MIGFYVCLTLGVPIRGKQTNEINKSSINEEYEEFHAVWMKECNIV